MRNNQPVTNHQRTFKKGSQLVSITDLNGVIEYVNNDFIDISGFSKEELIGENHHIIRHPYMPEAAFESLWVTVKADKEWRGIVKNRCKDGGIIGWMPTSFLFIERVKRSAINPFEVPRVKRRSKRLSSYTRKCAMTKA